MTIQRATAGSTKEKLAVVAEDAARLPFTELDLANGGLPAAAIVGLLDKIQGLSVREDDALRGALGLEAGAHEVRAALGTLMTGTENDTAGLAQGQVYMMGEAASNVVHYTASAATAARLMMSALRLAYTEATKMQHSVEAAQHEAMRAADAQHHLGSFLDTYINQL